MKPHVLHVTLGPEGYFDGWRLDCPHDVNDPDVERPCRMVADYGSDEFEPGCGGADYVNELGGEALSLPDVVDPVFPMEVDVRWEPVEEYFTVVAWSPDLNAGEKP